MEGYDAYSGFGRVNMVVPTLADPPPNVGPIADAGLDQTVQDSGKPGVEEVTLDGSGSSDPDGYIVSYEWRNESGDTIATGERVTLDLPVGQHTISLRVTDDQNSSSTAQVEIDIVGKKGDQTGDTTGNSPPKGSGNGRGKSPNKSS